MNRFSAQYIYYKNQLHKRSVIEIYEDRTFEIYSLTQEIEDTEFHNGLVLISDNNRVNKQMQQLQAGFLKSNNIIEVISAHNNEFATINEGKICLILLEQIDLQQLCWIPESSTIQIIN